MDDIDFEMRSKKHIADFPRAFGGDIRLAEGSLAAAWDLPMNLASGGSEKTITVEAAWTALEHLEAIGTYPPGVNLVQIAAALLAYQKKMGISPKTGTEVANEIEWPVRLRSRCGQLAATQRVLAYWARTFTTAAVSRLAGIRNSTRKCGGW
jgi:hypothetical protein